MKRARRSLSSLRASLRLGLLMLALAAGSLLVRGAGPAWWTQRGILNGQPADDYAVANQGQLKHIALKAYEDFQARLPGYSGYALSAMIEPWKKPDVTGTRDDFAAVSLGQLKTVAKPFYDRLMEAGIATGYPWTGSPTEADDYAVANLGQLKNVFSFDAGVDTDADGLADAWELAYLGTLGKGAGDSAGLGAGVTLLQAFQQNRIPTFYGDTLPILTVESGDGQGAAPGAPLPEPIVIRATDQMGNAYQNVPIDFVSESGTITGDGAIAASKHWARVKNECDRDCLGPRRDTQQCWPLCDSRERPGPPATGESARRFSDIGD